MTLLIRESKLDCNDHVVIAWCIINEVRIVILIMLCAADPPVIMRNPTADLVVQGRNASLQCRADGNPPVYYEWFRVSYIIIYVYREVIPTCHVIRAPPLPARRYQRVLKNVNRSLFYFKLILSTS